MCRNIGIKFLPWTYMYTAINFLGKHVIETNQSKFDERLFSDIIIFVQITFETRKRNTGFYVLRQGVPGGRSSEGHACFKQVKPWPWHVEVIPGVVVVGLVTDKELCQVVWRIIIKNLLYEYSFIVSELLW